MRAASAGLASFASSASPALPRLLYLACLAYLACFACLACLASPASRAPCLTNALSATRQVPYAGAPGFLYDRVSLQRLGENPYTVCISQGLPPEQSNQYLWRAMESRGQPLLTHVQAPYPCQHIANSRSLLHTAPYVPLLPRFRYRYRYRYHCHGRCCCGPHSLLVAHSGDWENLWATYRQGPLAGQPVDIPQFPLQELRRAVEAQGSSFSNYVRVKAEELGVKLPLMSMAQELSHPSHFVQPASNVAPPAHERAALRRGQQGG